MTTVDCSQYAATATLAIRCVNYWRDQLLLKRYNQWMEKRCRKLFDRWSLESIFRMCLPHLGENSSDESAGAPGLVPSSDDEQVRLPVVPTDSETDSDSDNDTVAVTVRHPDGSVELRQVPIALLQLRLSVD